MVNTYDGPPGWIRRSSETLVPCNCRGRGAGDGFSARDCPGAGGLGEELLKEAPVEIRFLRLRWIDCEARTGSRKVLVTHLQGRIRLESVDPAVANPVAELLFLTPQDRIR